MCEKKGKENTKFCLKKKKKKVKSGIDQPRGLVFRASDY
jgi:hypothetical protein